MDSLVWIDKLLFACVDCVFLFGERIRIVAPYDFKIRVRIDVKISMHFCSTLLD